VTKAIEASLQRFSVPRLMEYVGRQFPETRPSDVPWLLDTEMVKVFEDAAA
jgi:hypothetical protein